MNGTLRMRMMRTLGRSPSRAMISFEFGGDAESKDRLFHAYFHHPGYQMLVIALQCPILHSVYFIFDDGYFGSLHDAAHKQSIAGNHQTTSMAIVKVEDDGPGRK